MDLQNEFTKENYLYPEYRPQNLQLLDKHRKIVVPKTYASEGSSFSQVYSSKGKVGKGGDNKNFDKNYWKDKECYKCGKQGHPESHCTTVRKVQR